MPVMLVIDDDRSTLHMLRQGFKDVGITVVTAENSSEGLVAVREHRPDVILLDIMLPETSGLETFEKIHQIDSKLPVIFITSGGSSDTAIEAMKLGAYDYVLKPLNLTTVQKLVRQALETRRIMHVPVGVPAPDFTEHEGDMLVGRSPRILDVFKAIGRVASQDVTVLIRGESGTGKELVARAIYQHSPRSNGPFLAVNCAALPDSLLESELFGHEKGAYTGAESRRIGKFEQCSGGTIFLDEIGDMSPLVQSKVLRLLQQQTFERVGGNQTIQTDVRIITATNRDLEQMVADAEFRSDLYYRLNGFTIDLPPLRDRGNDILLLLEHFLVRFCREMGKHDVEGISPDAVNLLMRYHWPGNIRELQSVVRQALLNATGPVIVPDFLPDEIRFNHDTRRESFDAQAIPSNLKTFIDKRLTSDSHELYTETLEMMERYVLTRVLGETEGNQSKAAQILGITRGSLRNKIRSLRITIGQVISIEGDSPESE
jgi:two-component system nitrogen regulation response regulator GlnG